MRIAHISDLHFGHHDPEVTGALAGDLLEQAPDLIVASGDFTQRGTLAEFEMAHDFLDSLAVPVFAVPGNHDLGRNPLRRFLDPYRLYRRYIAPDIEPVSEFHVGGTDVVLAGLNTTRRAFVDRDWSNGSINPTQLDALGARFDHVNPHALRVVVAHHPLMQPTAPTDKPTRAVHRASLALETLAHYGVRLVLSGHFHLSFVRRYDKNAVREGIPPGPRQAAVAPVLVCQASTVISDRTRGEPNAYNVIDIDNDRIEIRVRQWGEGRWMTHERDVSGMAG
jgi:3',5'-cyclic AMP phosphodiesterase CpdA